MHLVNSEAATQVSLLDRGLLYGHSVFETVAVDDAKPLLLDAHLERMRAGCETLALPFDSKQVKADVLTLCSQYSESRFVARLSQTMGAGGRGYLSPAKPQGTRIVSAFPWPQQPTSHWEEGIVLGQVDLRLAAQPALAGIKHSNRLEQILARQQWQPTWHEAIILDQQDKVIEATQSNIFVWDGTALRTPDLSACGVAGIMRDQVIELATSELGLETKLVSLSTADLVDAQQVFVTNSLIGVWPVKKFLDHTYSSVELAQTLLEILQNHEAIPPR